MNAKSKYVLVEGQGTAGLRIGASGANVLNAMRWRLSCLTHIFMVAEVLPYEVLGISVLENPPTGVKPNVVKDTESPMRLLENDLNNLWPRLYLQEPVTENL